MASNISNLVYYYRFETSDLSGNTLDNLAPNSAYDLSLSSVSLINTTNYFVGQSSLNLNNTTATRQWANWPNGITLPSSSSGFSISFWVSALNLSSTTASLFDFSNSTNSITDPGKNAFYAVLSGNQMTVNLVSSGSNVGSLTCPVVETDGIWRHVLITYSSSNVVSVYVNGALCATGTFSDYPSTSYSYAYLGNDTTQSSYFLTGALDEFRIYNIVLSDVNDIYYLAYYPTYQPYITSPSVSGNTFSSNFYDSNQSSFTQYFTPRTVFPGTIVLFSGRPGQNVSAFDGSVGSYTYVSPTFVVIDNYSTALYVCDTTTGKLVQTDLTTGKIITLYTLPNITSVVVDASNTTYFVSDNVGNIRAVDLSSNTLNGNVLNGSYTNVTCLLLSQDKTRLYFSHSGGISYVSLPISSYPATPTLLYTNAGGILEIVFPQSGNASTIYAISTSSQIIYGVSTALSNTAYSITMPTGAFISGTKLSDCAFDTQGNMYISTHTGSCGIWMVPFYVVNAISSNTTLTTEQLKQFAGGGTFGYSGDGGPCLNAQFGKIEALICDTMDNLYFVDSMYAVVRKITGAGGKGTKFMNTITNEAGTDGYHDIAKIYSQSVSAGTVPEQVPLAYGTDGSLTNRIEGRFQSATHSIIDNSGLVIYYRFNSTDVSGAFIANYASGMPVYDASLNYDASNNIGPYISSNDFACENSALNISSTSLGSWQSISNALPTPNSTGLPPIPSVITPNRSYTSTPYYGSKFGHWNSVCASSTGSYVAAVGDYDVFYQLNSNQTAGAQQKWTPMYSPPTTNTVFGTGGSTYTGDLGYALSASGITIKGIRIINGDYYIADYGNNRVRVIYSSSGIVNTICGTGTSSSTGDGGLATAATIQGPSDIIMDASNNIYISELYKVRVIYGNGIISTFAGTGTASSTGDRGLATAATFNVINNIQFDSSYNMYVCEQTGGRVRIIYRGNNIVGTLAGGGATSGDGGQAISAILSNPVYIAVDNSRNIYISEQTTNKIRLVTNSTGIISTIIGSGLNQNSGVSGLSANIAGPTGLTFDASKNNLYFAHTTLGKISYYNVSSGLVYNVLNNGNVAGAAGMDTNPFISRGSTLNCMTMDTSDNLYFTDTGNYRLRRISTITPFPGFTQSPFPIAVMLACGGLSWEFIKINGTGQYQIAYAKCYGAFLSSSYGANTSWNYVLDLSGIYIKSAAISFTGQYISATDPYGNVYVSSGYGANGSWSQKYINTQNIYNTAGPTSIAMSTTGQYQVATTYNTETILPFLGSGASGYVGEGAPWAVTLNGSTTLAFDSSNNMLFADRLNHRFRKYTLNTNATTLLMGTGSNFFPTPATGTALGAHLNYPKGVVCDVSNNFYINLYQGLLVISGLTYRVIAGSGTSGSAGDTLVASTTTSFSENQYVVVNQLGDFFITDYTNNKVRAISSGNNFVSTVVGTGTGSTTGDGGLARLATTQNPVAIAYDSFNNMYITAAAGNTVRKVDALTGIITRIVGTGTASSTGDGGQAQNATVNTPYVYVDPYNNLYVPELGSNCIRKVIPTNNQINPTSTIITYVGNSRAASSTGNYGLPANATINAPEHSMFHDNYGAGYVMDKASYYIRKTVQCSNIIVSTDYGNTWTNKTTALTGNIWFNNVAINSTGQYMSATTIYGNSYICTGNIYTSSDFGNTWVLNNSAPTRPWGCITISSTGQYQFAAGYDMSGGYYSTDYGQTWSLGNLPSGNWCDLAWVESKNTMYAVSKNIGGFTSVFYNTNFNLAAAGSRRSQFVASGNTIVSSASWPTVNGLTFATWVKSNSNADFAKIFDFGTGATPLSNNIVMGVYGNILYYGVYNGTTPGNTFTQIGINDNSWKHIAITMTYAPSGSNTSMHSVYINGVIATRNYNTGNTRYPNQVVRPACYIGKGSLASDPSFNGVIDDFRVYNRVLTDREIYKLYAPTEAVHLYKFDNEDYDQTGVFLANYAPKNVVWDALHTCKFTPPPLITTNTVVSGTVGKRMFSGLTGNLASFAVNQSNDYGITVYNALTIQFTFFNPTVRTWAALTNTNITNYNITCCKMINSGAEMLMCIPGATSVRGIYTCNRTSANAFYLNAPTDDTNRNYNGIDAMLNGSRFVAIADYVYFAEWNSAIYNYNVCTQTSLYTGLTNATQKDIAMTGDGSRIIYSDINSNLYFATWNSTLYTYTGATLIANLPANSYTGITVSNDGLLLFYAYNISGTISLFYAIWNGTTYSGITNISSVISGSYLLFSVSNVNIKLTYDMQTLYLTSNGYNGSTYAGFIVPISLSYTNTLAGYRKYGSNSLTMRANSLCITRNHPLPTVSTYTTTPWSIGNAVYFLSISDDYSIAIVCSSVNGRLYYSLYSPHSNTWSTYTTTLESTIINQVDGKLTGDGRRFVCITSSAAYFCTWNGINFSTLTRTLDTTPLTFLSCDLTNDGSRFFVMTRSYIYYADWNGTNYGQWISTGIPFVGGIGSYAALGCSGDGSRIAYSFFDSNGVAACNGNIWYAYLNGSNYTQFPYPLYTQTNTVGNVRIIRISKDGMFLIHTWINNTASPRLFTWIKNNYAYVLAMSSFGTSSGAGLAILPNLDRVVVITSTPAAIEVRLFWASVYSFTSPSTTIAPNFYSAGTSGFTGLSITSDDTRMVLGNYSTGFIYYTTKRPEVNTWNLSNIIKTQQTVLPGNQLNSLKITADGKRGVYGLNSNGSHFVFNWIPEQNNYSSGIAVLGGTSAGALHIDVSLDGSLLLAQRGSTIFYAYWIGWNYGTWYNTGFSSNAMSIDGAGYKMVYLDSTTMYFAIWNGYSYIQMNNRSNVSNAGYRRIWLNYDGTYGFYTSSGQTVKFFVWDGIKYPDVIAVPATSIPTGDMWPFEVAGNRKTIYYGNQSTISFGQTSINLQTAPIVGYFTIPSPYSIITSFSSANTLTPSIGQCGGIAVNQAGTRMIITDKTTGLMYVSTYFGGAWSAFQQTLQTTQLGSGYALQMRLTADGSRGVMSVGTTNTMYFFTWNGSNYSTYQTTAVTAASAFTGIDLTADGGRAFLVNTTAIYWSDWNGLSYGPVQTTGIAGAVTNSYVACNTDGSRIVYNINTTNWTYAVWNGITYVPQNTFSSMLTAASIRSVIWSYDNQYVFWTIYLNASASLAYAVWNQDLNNFTNSGYVSTAAVPANLTNSAMAIDNTGVYEVTLTTPTIYRMPLNYTTVPTSVQGYSFAYWFKNQGSQDYAGLISFQGVNGWIMMFLIGNALYATVNEQAFSLPTNILPTTMLNHVQVATVAQNTWYHVCWTIQQVNTSYNTVGSAIWTVYLNGQQVYQSSAQRYPYPGKRSLNFLAFNGLNNVYLNGNVDDYRTYQTILTADEVLNIYNTTNVFQ